MKDLFINLFNYDCSCNLQMAEKIVTAKSPEKPLQLMAHLLAAQHIWINRCRGFENQNDLVLWPRLKAISFEPLIYNNHDDWKVFIKNMREADFETEISYHTSSGEPYTNKLTDILFHVINHGTHHRAQIGQMLKLNSKAELPNTDYIYYVRN